jgi:LPS export ABC transporter protein LptC
MTRPVLLLIFAAALLGACTDDSTTPSATASVEELPTDDVIYGIHQVMTKDGIRTGVMDSDTAYLRESGEQLDLRGVHITFYNETGSESGTLTSRTGDYDVSTGAFVARGNAVLITRGEDGRRVESEELHYDVKGDRLWTDKPFVMRQGEQVTRGQSFRSDSKFQNFTVMGASTTGGLPKGAAGAGNSDLSF